MHTTGQRQFFLDTLVELAGIKSGLAVTVPKALSLLGKSDVSSGWWRGKRNGYVRLGGTEIEEAFCLLLYRLGAIPDPKCSGGRLVDYCRSLPFFEKDNDEPVTPTPRHLYEVSMIIGSAFNSHFITGDKLPKDLTKLPGFSAFYNDYKMRDIMNNNMPEHRTWDGIIQLSELFEGESAPDDKDTYFDQRFIDYLNAQPGDLAKMHWRKFEHLAAEFFHRYGYKVQVGPGRKDGGKDLVASKDGNVVGPEIIYVQCKRLGPKQLVRIEDVKALWTTVNDDNATRGLIATTSRLARGAKKYCDARQYRLDSAESEKVQKWVAGMATFADGSNTKQGR